ncbi:LamG-like jellyroll fold domain-containing protein, partial [Pseudokineococcus sp. 1T1Z-3]|uniref:LamG-like jellyroll fold domain-containing protein n=1 Tax=Pseudokineococcus sp. 1T1Z-3 TaxID=3132745 RepID=UPI0030B0E097
MVSAGVLLRSVLVAAVSALTLVAALLVPASPALAAQDGDVPPALPTPATVTADALPTVQVNGVVWDQVVVGDRVYVTGEFTKARPAGAAVGTRETDRRNLLAYDIRTGELITSWAPRLDGRGLVIEASADGRRIYVGGDFDRANDTQRTRLAAFDASSGALVAGFTTQARGRVGALAVSGSTLYVGGDFTTLGGQPRERLAAVDAGTGRLLAWTPSADREVMSLVAPQGSGRVVASGRFDTLSGIEAPGMGALDASTGATLSWAANQTIQNHGPDSAIWSLSTDGRQVYGTGYDFYGPSEFEASFAAGVDGRLVWVNGCKGDTYGSVPIGGVLYSVGHPHNCSTIGGHPQEEPWTFQRALATTTDARGSNLDSFFRGQPAPTLLHWQPTIALGQYTKQYQGAWTVTGDDRYLLLGGEFPRVNGVAQQGLVRFAVSSIAPRKDGPQGWAELKPDLVVLGGTVRAAWTAAWDRDDDELTYELLRGQNAWSATVVDTVTRTGSSWWNRPRMTMRDPSAPPGTTQTYRVRVTDGAGNSVQSQLTTVEVPQAGGEVAGDYVDEVLADGATAYWRLGEPSGSLAYDWAGGDDLRLDQGVTRGVEGPLAGDAAVRLNGSGAVPATTTTRTQAPDTFSVEAWFRTTSTAGGKIVGFGNSTTGNSGSYDRHVYLDGSGRVRFGVWPGSARLLTSQTGFNDGQWHHVVATLGAQGQSLYVDGRRVGRDGGTTSGQSYAGYWRVGGDTLGSWPGAGATHLAGDVDEVAVYGTQLSTEQVRSHYVASGRASSFPPAPADGYGQAVLADDPQVYWRLDSVDAGATPDLSAGLRPGRVSGGVAVQEPGGVYGSAAAATTDGSTGVVATSEAAPAPGVYSQEVWFSTTTRRGGKLMGFGNAQTGSSTSVDRHVEMRDDGRLSFGVYVGRRVAVVTERSYNDGAWHHVVATQGPTGMRLYVDGELVASGTETRAEARNGFWRVGGDRGWSSTSPYFAGRLDEAALYTSVLGAETVRAHYRAGLEPQDEPPTAAFTAEVA